MTYGRPYFSSSSFLTPGHTCWGLGFGVSGRWLGVRLRVVMGGMICSREYGFLGGGLGGEGGWGLGGGQVEVNDILDS